MTQTIDLSLSPTGGNAVATVRITPELIEFHQPAYELGERLGLGGIPVLKLLVG